MACYDCDWYDECDHSYCKEDATFNSKMQLSEEDATFKRRLINANDLYRKVSDYKYGAVDKTVAKRLIEQQPTIDAVEVVRCKDCKWSDWYTCEDGVKRCYCMEHGSSGHGDDDFCSYAERRTDAETKV